MVKTARHHRKCRAFRLPILPTLRTAGQWHAAALTDAEAIVTKTGKVLTDADVHALADEAERGYDIT